MTKKGRGGEGERGRVYTRICDERNSKTRVRTLYLYTYNVHVHAHFVQNCSSALGGTWKLLCVHGS